MREFVTDEMVLEMAYRAHREVRFVALGHGAGERIFASPPEVADAIFHELDMELLPHVQIAVFGGEVRPLASVDGLPADARETARALELAGHRLWAFHVAGSGTIVAIGVDEVAPANRALEVSGLRRVSDPTCGVRWTLDLQADPPPPAAPPKPPPPRVRPSPPDPWYRFDLDVFDVTDTFGTLEAILRVTFEHRPAYSSQKLGAFAHDPSHVDRYSWQAPGAVVHFEREVQHLYGIDTSYKIQVALEAPPTTIEFVDLPPGEVVVRGAHPDAPAVAAWLRELVRRP